MTAVLPEKAVEWLDNHEFATFACLEPDGRPHASVVWIERDGEELLVSTMKGRKKHRNVLRDPRVTIVVFPLADPYSYVEVRGTCTVEEEGAVDLINRMCEAYMGYGIDHDPTDRIIIRVRPEIVVFHPSRTLTAELAEQAARLGDPPAH